MPLSYDAYMNTEHDGTTPESGLGSGANFYAAELGKTDWKIRAGELNIPETLTFTDYAELTAGSASYEQAKDPEMVLRSGLIEETIEIIDTDISNRDELTKELGDALWYMSEIARFKGMALAEVLGTEEEAPSLDGFQEAALEAEVPYHPINTPDGGQLKAEDRPADALAVTMLRVVDKLNPKTPELWLGYDEPITLSESINDAMVCISRVASDNDISLNEAAIKTLIKNNDRQRNPHVVDGAEDLANSGRDRMRIDPWIVKLVLSANEG